MRWWSRGLLGALGVVALFVAVGGAYALARPYFAGTDETAHVGYAQSIAHFEQPTIDGQPPVPAAARLWQLERATADEAHRTVWVANHPPLFYVATAPLMWLSNALDREDGGLMFLRAANLLATAVGVLVTFLFAREVTGRARLAVATAAVLAFTGLVPAVTSLALNDGAALAAAAGLGWSAARLIRRAPEGRWAGRDVGLLATAGVVAWGVRASTMLMAVAVVALLGAVALFASRPQDRARHLGVVVVGGGLVPAVAFGGFYLRNIVRYGDLGASAYLFERFEREPLGSVFATLRSGHLWHDIVRELSAPSTAQELVLPMLDLVIGVALAGLVVAAAQWRSRNAPQRRRLAWHGALIAVAVAVPVVLTAQHLAGGGSAHARYLLPLLVPGALLVVVGLDRVGGRIAPAAFVALLLWWAVIHVPTAADRLEDRRVRDRIVLGMAELDRLPGSPGWRALLVVVGLVGTGLMFAGLLRPDGRGRRSEPAMACVAQETEPVAALG